MSTTKLNFDRESCGRCCGTGHYSFCTAYGTTCFGCAGTGTKLTRKGKKAHAAWGAFLEANTMIRAGDVTPGMRVRVSLGDKFCTVIETRVSGCASITRDVDGNEIRTPFFDIVFQKMTYGVPSADTLVYRTFTLADMHAFAATQKTGVALEEIA